MMRRYVRRHLAEVAMWQAFGVVWRWQWQFQGSIVPLNHE